MAKKNVAQPGKPAVSAATGASRQRANDARKKLEQAGKSGATAAEVDPDTEYPRAMYRKTSVSAKYPMGYEVRRVKSAADEAKLNAKTWKRSPTQLYKEHPAPLDAPPADPDAEPEPDDE